MLRKSISPIALVLGLLGAVLPVHAQPTPARPTAEEEAKLARADDLYRRANELVKAMSFAEAHALYVEAFALKRSFDIAGNLADMENELGKFRDAAEHAAYSLRIFPPNGKARAKTRTVEVLERAKKEVCTVRVTASVPGTDVFVDGQKVGRAPMGFEIYAEPGERTFRGVAAGHQEVGVTRACAKGEVIDVALDLAPLPGAVSTVPTTNVPLPPVVPPGTASPDASKPIWPAVLLGGVAVVGVGVGIGLTVHAADENADAVSTFRSCGRLAVCEEAAQGSVDAANVLQGVAIAGFAIGAASLTGMVLYLAIPDATSQRSALHVVPSVGPTTQGLSVGGRF